MFGQRQHEGQRVFSHRAVIGVRADHHRNSGRAHGRDIDGVVAHADSRYHVQATGRIQFRGAEWGQPEDDAMYRIEAVQ
ncbi:hypothetical protein D9M69_719270 [compost metagenome]